MITEKAWAAFHPDGIPRPFIHSGAIGSRRRDVHEKIGSAYQRDGETIMQGWRRAYRFGWRAVRVTVILRDCEHV